MGGRTDEATITHPPRVSHTNKSSALGGAAIFKGRPWTHMEPGSGYYLARCSTAVFIFLAAPIMLTLVQTISYKNQNLLGSL